MSSDWDGLIVIASPNHHDGLRMAEWHIADRLSRQVPVLFADPPRSPWSDAAPRPAGPLLRVIRPGLARLTPLVQPFPGRRGMTGVTTVLARRHLARAVARLGSPRVRAVLSGWPLYPPGRGLRPAVSGYWASDDFTAGAPLLGLPAGLLARKEARQARDADLVIACSEVLAERWPGAVALPSGVDAAMYAGTDEAPVPAAARGLRGPVAGFVGRLNQRTDLALLEAVADAGTSLLVVGPADPSFEPARVRALLGRPGVRHAGQQPPEALPGFLRAIDVGLVPYAGTPFNRSSFPLKILEYLAAGRAVVSTSLPSAVSLGTGLITLADGPREFAAAVAAQASAPRTPALAAARREFAAGHDWQARADALLALIEDAAASRKRRHAARGARTLEDVTAAVTPPGASTGRMRRDGTTVSE